MRRRFGLYEWGTLAIAAVVLGFTIAQAIREHSWEPIWMVAWLPAVLVASLSRPHRPGDCWRRLRRRAGS
jgi:hypothetical protein